MRILVVDDEAQILALFKQRFRHEISRGELTFTFAQSGEEALTSLPDSGIILILSDINMPGMSGLELLRRIRDMHPQRPPAIVMTTAYGDAKNRQQAKSYGADDFLTKPLDFALLKQKLVQLAGSGPPIYPIHDDHKDFGGGRRGEHTAADETALPA